MDYVKFFALECEPFQNDFDDHFYFESEPQRRARMRLLRGIHQRKGLCVLLGGPGLGKTTLAHQLLRELAPEDFSAHMLLSSHRECARAWFLPHVARIFGVEAPAARPPEQIDQIHAALLEVRMGGQHPVLFVDEAQLLSEAVAMEEFRALLNLTHDGQRLFTLVLFGMEDLGPVLELDPSLAQRVDVRAAITTMSPEETAAYVTHRMTRAGGSADVWAPDALEALHRYSGGIPRVVNTLADNALFEASLTQTQPVDGSLVAAAAEDLHLQAAAGEASPSSFHAVSAPPVPVTLTPQVPEEEKVFGENTAETLGKPAADWLEPVAPMPGDGLDDAGEPGLPLSDAPELELSEPEVSLSTPEVEHPEPEIELPEPAIELSEPELPDPPSHASAADELADLDPELSLSGLLAEAEAESASPVPVPEIAPEIASAVAPEPVRDFEDSLEGEGEGEGAEVADDSLAAWVRSGPEADDRARDVGDPNDEDEISLLDALDPVEEDPGFADGPDADDAGEESGFDLGVLLAEEDEPATEESAAARPKGPQIDLDDDLDSLFDEIVDD